MPVQPQVSWSQRKQAIFLTVEVVDAENIQVDIKEDSVSVTCKKGTVDYAITLPLHDKINPEASRWASTRGIIMHLEKATSARWPSLLKNKEKRSNLKVDWQRWLDTDDEEEAAAGGAGGFDMGGFDMNSLGGMGGMPNMDDMNFDDMKLNADESDDDGEDEEEATGGCCPDDKCSHSAAEGKSGEPTVEPIA